ncbi:hypothetical protein KC19_6G226100 [Ceratodon purpureus]|uniref:Uncharacterized protein n=1 Tax=Ceratodon purpureus TaxID=3225 RepID=A0A8T0HKG2_CERPU|nr:hypothetical protein KC19_6G226000 [Ceratodon purpureus]KAG0571288.1 hypothetical protein KC19_6G226100 [Ceratodon purpureus]
MQFIAFPYLLHPYSNQFWSYVPRCTSIGCHMGTSHGTFLGLGKPKVRYFCTNILNVIILGPPDQNILGLQISVGNSFLMDVIHSFCYLKHGVTCYRDAEREHPRL